MQTMAAGAVFTDITYDGVIRNGLSYNGLGQMTDSLLGPSDFELLDPTDNKGTIAIDKFISSFTKQQLENLV